MHLQKSSLQAGEQTHVRTLLPLPLVSAEMWPAESLERRRILCGK
jgi:hypothetical protein